MFALAGVGLFAIFNAIQGATDSVDQSMAPTALQALLDNAAAAEGSRHSGTRYAHVGGDVIPRVRQGISPSNTRQLTVV